MSPSARVKWIIGLPPEVGEHHRMVLVVLDSHADGSSGECRPSVRTIVKESAISERIVRGTIQDLAEWGLIEVNHNPGRPTDYVVKWNAEPLRLPQDHPCGSRRTPLRHTQDTPAAPAGPPLRLPQGPLRHTQDTPAAPAGPLIKDPEQVFEQNIDSRPAPADAAAATTTSKPVDEKAPANDPPPAPAEATAPTLRMATPEEVAARHRAEAEDRRRRREQLIPRLSGVLSFTDGLPRPVLDTLPLPQDERAWQMCTGRHAGQHGEGDPHGLLPKLRWNDPKQPVDWRRILRVLADRGAYRLWHRAMRQALAGEKSPSWEEAMQMAHRARGQLDAQREQLVDKAESQERYAEVQAIQAETARRREAERQERNAAYYDRHPDERPEVHDGQ